MTPRPRRRSSVPASPIAIVTTVALVTLLVGGCGAAPALPKASPESLDRAPGVSQAPSAPTPTTAVVTLSPTLAPTVAPLPSAPGGTRLVDVPEARVRVPVPLGWRAIRGDELDDAGVRATLLDRHPGSASLLATLDGVRARATPVLVALDDAAPADAAVPASLAVLVSQPSVGGPLLELVAGFIERGLSDALHAPAAPVRDHVSLPSGDAVRLRYTLPAAAGEPVGAWAWIVGAPGGTVLLVVIGRGADMGGPDAEAIAAGMMPDR